jgi:hypothetical protein
MNASWPPGFGINVMPILVTIPKLDCEKMPLCSVSFPLANTHLRLKPRIAHSEYGPNP